jgi:phage head maturation protease
LPTAASQHQVKILGATKDGFRVGGYGVVWDGQDLSGDFFTAETDFWFDRLTQSPMVLYQHGQEGALKSVVVGRVDAKRVDEVGLWIEAQITAAKRYADAIRHLVDQGVLGWSSGAVSYLVGRVKAAGGRSRITSWPVAEFSLTPTPAEPRTLGVRAIKALATVDPGLADALDDLDLEDGRAPRTANGGPMDIDALPNSAFAFVEPGELDTERKTIPRAKRHFPHHGPDGALDPDMLRVAVDAAVEDRSEVGVKALPHLLRHAAGHDDADHPIWAAGAAPGLLIQAHRLAALAEEVADEQKAMLQLRIDTKTGARMQAQMRQQLRTVIDSLAALEKWGEYADRDEEGKAAAEYARRQVKLMEVSLWPT